MGKKPISRLNRKQLGRLFATITDKDDSAIDGSRDQTIKQEDSREQNITPEEASASAETIRSDTPLMEQPGTWIGRYKLLKVLGEGGMGVVYLAEQQRPIKRQVAIKLIKPGMDSKRVVARFEAEQQALALMDHPHIAHVFDAGLTMSGRPYFVMEHVEGIPITRTL